MTDKDPARSPNPRGEWFVLGEDNRTPVDVGDETAFRYWMNDRYIRRYVHETWLADYIITTLFWGHAEEGPDKLFETAIVEDELHKVLIARKPALAIWRCATWDEAERQHEQALAWLKERLEARRSDARP